jgi:hypothetical protein
MQCPDISVVACLTMLLELNDVYDDAIKRATGFVSAWSSTDVFLHLSLDA